MASFLPAYHRRQANRGRVGIPALRGWSVSTAPAGEHLPADAPEPANSDIYDGVLVDALKHFQERHGIDPDGRIGKTTLKAVECAVETAKSASCSLRWSAGGGFRIPSNSRPSL